MFGLKENTVEQIKIVFSTFPEIEKVVLYGSRAIGNYKAGSDIDLTVLGMDINLSVINRISLKLDDLFLPYTFDLSVYNQINNPALINHIERVGIVFYEKIISS